MAHSSAGTPMAQASGQNSQPATRCKVSPVSGSNAAFASATSATNTMSDAMMPSSSPSPSAVPRTSASMVLS